MIIAYLKRDIVYINLKNLKSKTQITSFSDSSEIERIS